MYLSKLWCNYLWCHTSIFDWIPLFLLWCFHHYFDSVIPALMLFPWFDASFTAFILLSLLCCFYICSTTSIPALLLLYYSPCFYVSSCFCQSLNATIPILKLLSLQSSCLCCFGFSSLLWHFLQWYDASIPIVKFLPLLSSFYLYCQVSIPHVKLPFLLSYYIFILMLLPLLCCFIPFFDASLNNMMLLSLL